MLLSLIFFSLVSLVCSGHVGLCRTECVEQNQFKIVRVHLKENLVMAGVCRNTTQTQGNLSTVVPFVCKREEGVWEFDQSDEEGIVPFMLRCPSNNPVPPEVVSTCPNATPTI